MPSSAPRRRVERVLAAALAVELAAGVAGAVLLQPSPRSPLAHGHPAPGRAANVRTDPAARTLAVRQLLAARAAAVLHKDRAAFLATVDPAGAAFLARQARLIDALRDVPVASWEYVVDPSTQRPHTAALDARGTWWAPHVTLRYALAGFDRTPTSHEQGLTFLQRGARWYLAADDDFAAAGHPTAREVWDGGRVVVTRGASCVVLAHPGHARLARTLVDECDAAVPRVTAVWGRGWAQRVVVVLPDSTAELSRVVPGVGDLSQIAALATAELDQPARGYHPVGDRVFVNPVTFRQLGSVGRRVVMTHEVTHVASRAATGPGAPTWLVEGLADYVGYGGVRIPLADSAHELQVEVRAGKLPSALPADAAFDGSQAELAQTYEQSWLAVVLLVRTYGQAAVLDLYRQAGADLRPGALERAAQRVLRTTLAAFTRAWRADLKRRLS